MPPGLRQRFVRRRSGSQELPYLVDAAAFAGQVNDGVAVRANRPQVGYRIHFVFRADLRQRLEVVNVDEPLGEGTIDGTEVKAAHHTGRPIMGYAASASDGITLVGVDDDLAGRALEMAPWRPDTLTSSGSRTGCGAMAGNG